jgi:hypothetical protein
MKVSARSVVDTPAAFRGGLWEVTDVHSRFDTVQVRVEARDNWIIQVTFDGVLNLRVVDERDLMEYWPTCSSPNGWLFEIFEGGLLDQERARQGSLIGALNGEVTEYLITGACQCVSVLTTGEPKVIVGPLPD